MALYFYHTEIGQIGIEENDNKISAIYIENEQKLNTTPKIAETKVIKETAKQIKAYFRGELTQFSVEFSLGGTEFMRRVWLELVKIPYGQTATYGEIAKRVGSPKGYRAVGLANNRNPIPIIIPCHRVIGADGSLVGFRSGLHIKQKLLDLEKRYNPVKVSPEL
jgi:methylated-DNA-[protein]-cysteine S-methyltransferase